MEVYDERKEMHVLKRLENLKYVRSLTRVMLIHTPCLLMYDHIVLMNYVTTLACWDFFWLRE